MTQKLIRVGNSYAIILPKPFVKKTNMKVGDDLVVEANTDIPALYIRPKIKADQAGLTPEFKEWLDDISEKEADIIKALAKV
jgi:antitoxin component of MazEF toxin-antitoxin module